MWRDRAQMTGQILESVLLESYLIFWFMRSTAEGPRMREAGSIASLQLSLPPSGNEGPKTPKRIKRRVAAVISRYTRPL